MNRFTQFFLQNAWQLLVALVALIMAWTTLNMRVTTIEAQQIEDKKSGNIVTALVEKINAIDARTQRIEDKLDLHLNIK